MDFYYLNWSNFSVPEYDVVPVRHNRYKRSDRSLRMQFSAFGKEIDTYLHPSDGQLAGVNTPVWLASAKSDGTVEYKKMQEGVSFYSARYILRVVTLLCTTYTIYKSRSLTQCAFPNLQIVGILVSKFYSSPTDLSTVVVDQPKDISLSFVSQQHCCRFENNWLAHYTEIAPHHFRTVLSVACLFVRYRSVFRRKWDPNGVVKLQMRVGLC